MATEKRLIDANALVKQLERSHEYHARNCREEVLLYRDIRIINEQQAVDAVEVVHGRWEPREDVKGFVCCSVCHDCNIYDEWPDGKKWNYCPNCGAKMDGERKDNGKKENDIG